MKKIDYLNNINAPYRDKSLKNIKGEKWEAIPGVEGVFEISNFGRIKSLAREIYYTNGKVIHRKECIIMAGVSPAPNYYTGDYTYQLAAHLSTAGKIYHFSVARLVYNCFVREIDLDDDSINVIQKDGNGLNCHYKNLKAVSSIEKQKRIYTLKRNISCFSWLDMKAIAKKGAENREQPVTQYSSEGKRIKVFESIKAASEATGIKRSGISAVLAGSYQTAGGFVWKRGKGERQIDLTGYFDAWRKSWKEKRGKKIIQYSLDKRKIKTYPSISDAAAQTGIPFSNISRAAGGYLKTAGGYKWKAVN